KKQLNAIELTALPELKAKLHQKMYAELSATDRADIKESILSYHATQQDEEITYHHSMMCAAIAHPDKKIVVPLAQEPVMRSDGSTKNDCERNATKRFIADFRREHPHLKVIAVQDAIASNYPNLKQLQEANIRYIVGAKPGDHKALFAQAHRVTCQEY